MKNEKVTLFKSKEHASHETLLSFWKRAQKGILLLLCVIVLGLATYQGTRYFQKSRMRNMQAAFMSLKDDVQRLAFAKKYASLPLGGLVTLSLADDAYKMGKYEDAADLYSKARKGLKDTLFYQRAKLGQGIALIAAGKADKGKERLKKLALDKGTSAIIAAEAFFTLAVSEFEGKHYSDCKMYLGEVYKIPSAGIFIEKAKILEEQLEKSVK
ncbi:MAG: hypothetical protein A2Y14_02325 [Verrucomicrobia bacterium GWF2_51_19]|nr:MAG: hypothetical protein A2Y14_02325 [Verrucomicrobia bacterium GWF2_51_19]HCJ11908.1 hypothetical protein [Opitutae bacterium]